MQNPTSQTFQDTGRCIKCGTRCKWVTVNYDNGTLTLVGFCHGVTETIIRKNFMSGYTYQTIEDMLFFLPTKESEKKRSTIILDGANTIGQMEEQYRKAWMKESERRKDQFESDILAKEEFKKLELMRRISELESRLRDASRSGSIVSPDLEIVASGGREYDLEKE